MKKKKSTEKIHEMLDKIGALGMISVFDIEEIGPQILTEELGITDELADIMVASSSNRAREVEVERERDAHREHDDPDELHQPEEQQEAHGWAYRSRPGGCQITAPRSGRSPRPRPGPARARRLGRPPTRSRSRGSWATSRSVA